MLNLKELARKLDEALAKETPETLTKWLMGKRNKSIESFVGKGVHRLFIKSEIEELQEVIIMHKDNNDYCQSPDNTIGDSYFAQAA